MRALSVAALVFIFSPCLLIPDETNLVLTIGGVTYSNVTWGTVTPASAAMFHSSGVTVVPLEKLPQEWQTQFNYDPAKAAAYRAEQAKAQTPDISRLDRAATSQALDRAVATRSYLSSFEREMDKHWDYVESIRWRYKEFLKLQKEGHPDYRVAVDLLAEACRRAIEHHYHLKKYRPEYRDAERKLQNFRSTGKNIPDSINLQHLAATNAAAQSYYREEKRLHDEALKAWAEGLKQKQIADSKWRPAPPPPKPKSKDPYLEEQP
jgi:hypothetical protein